MAFNNYDHMLYELLTATVDNKELQDYLHQCSKSALKEADINEIVRLYNIHCMPKNRWDN